MISLTDFLLYGYQLRMTYIENDCLITSYFLKSFNLYYRMFWNHSQNELIIQKVEENKIEEKFKGVINTVEEIEPIINKSFN